MQKTTLVERWLEEDGSKVDTCSTEGIEGDNH